MEYEITSYIDGVANGDPVIVYSPETRAIVLGTGFTSFESIRREIERVVDVQDGQRFDVFGVDGHIEFSETNETLKANTH
jgi:hypothetical protein